MIDHTPHTPLVSCLPIAICWCLIWDRLELRKYLNETLCEPRGATALDGELWSPETRGFSVAILKSRWHDDYRVLLKHRNGNMMKHVSILNGAMEGTAEASLLWDLDLTWGFAVWLRKGWCSQSWDGRPCGPMNGGTPKWWLRSYVPIESDLGWSSVITQMRPPNQMVIVKNYNFWMM